MLEDEGVQRFNALAATPLAERSVERSGISGRGEWGSLGFPQRRAVLGAVKGALRRFAVASQPLTAPARGAGAGPPLASGGTNERRRPPKESTMLRIHSVIVQLVREIAPVAASIERKDRLACEHGRGSLPKRLTCDRRLCPRRGAAARRRRAVSALRGQPPAKRGTRPARGARRRDPAGACDSLRIERTLNGEHKRERARRGEILRARLCLRR
jgi:hypothetical protein